VIDRDGRQDIAEGGSCVAGLPVRRGDGRDDLQFAQVEGLLRRVVDRRPIDGLAVGDGLGDRDELWVVSDHGAWLR
jgi:hypothetical protein